MMLTNHSADTANNGIQVGNKSNGKETPQAEAERFIQSVSRPITGAMVSNQNGLFTDVGQDGVQLQSSIYKFQPAILKKSVHLSSWQSTLHPLQEWEGYVVEINGDEFIARLLDVTAGDEYETEEVTIPVEELSNRDADRLEEGKFFRWVIGYERTRAGTKKLVSQITFRDLPRRTARDLERAREWAESMESFLNG